MGHHLDPQLVHQPVHQLAHQATPLWGVLPGGVQTALLYGRTGELYLESWGTRPDESKQVIGQAAPPRHIRVTDYVPKL